MTIEFDIVVEAEDNDEAADIAMEYAGEELDNAINMQDKGVFVDVQTISTLSELPLKWHDAIPWANPWDKEDKTCRQILEEGINDNNDGE
jgi:hypothetical protein